MFSLLIRTLPEFWAVRISILQVLYFCGPWKHLPYIAPKEAKSFFVPTNLDLVDILENTDLDFEIFAFGGFLWITNFQIPGFQDPRLAQDLWGDSGRFLDGVPGPQNAGDPRN